MQPNSRNSFSNSGWTLEKANEFSFFSDFECGESDLDDFIRHDAEKHRAELLAETYILREATVKSDFPVAFISFCNDAIQLSKSARRRMLPRKKQYPFLPAVKIARLGVQTPFQNKNIGTLLINMAKKFFLHDNRTGCRFMTVDAYNKPLVINFYKKNGFAFLSEADQNKNTRSMYFDLKRLIAAPHA
jgi:GNAT superfamily N-acetyltransferase